jgi:hypothetical protein
VKVTVGPRVCVTVGVGVSLTVGVGVLLTVGRGVIVGVLVGHSGLPLAPNTTHDIVTDRS